MWISFRYIRLYLCLHSSKHMTDLRDIIFQIFRSLDDDDDIFPLYFPSNFHESQTKRAISIKYTSSYKILTCGVNRCITAVCFFKSPLSSNSINKPTRRTFCMYLFYNLFVTLHVSNDYFVHHQEFINLLYLQLCTNHANVPNCSALRLELCCVAIATQYKPCKRA